MQRFLLVIIGILVLTLAVGFFWLTSSHRQTVAKEQERAEELLAETRQETVEVVRELCEDLARVLATAIAPAVARGEFAALESELAAMVRGHRLVGVIVLDGTGRVLASTDRHWAGRTLDDPLSRQALAVSEVVAAQDGPAPGQREIHAPLLVGTQQIGALRVIFELGERASHL